MYQNLYFPFQSFGSWSYDKYLKLFKNYISRVFKKIINIKTTLLHLIQVNLNKTRPLDFEIALGPHKDNTHKQTDYLAGLFIPQNGYFVDNSTSIWFRSLHFLYTWYNWEMKRVASHHCLFSKLIHILIRITPKRGSPSSKEIVCYSFTHQQH